jgi:hypothetical protein
VALEAAAVAELAADTASTKSSKWSVSVKESPTTLSATQI